MTVIYNRQISYNRPDFAIHVAPHVVHIVNENVRHRHTFSELVIVTCGTASHQTGSEAFHISTGDILVINGQREHTYADTNDFEIMNVLYEPEELTRVPADLQSLPGFRMIFMNELNEVSDHYRSHTRLSKDDLLVAKNLAYRLYVTVLDRKYGFETDARNMLAQLFRHIAACAVKPMGQQTDAHGVLAAKVLAYFESNYADDITLAKVAQTTGTSKSTVQRVFSKVLGHSPIEHLLHIRIDKAKALLADTNLKITDVAFGVGFRDSNYFARMFRRIVGTTPSEFRRQRMDGRGNG